MNKPAPILNETLLYWDELHPTYPYGIGLNEFRLGYTKCLTSSACPGFWRNDKKIRSLARLEEALVAHRFDRGTRSVCLLGSPATASLAISLKAIGLDSLKCSGGIRIAIRAGIAIVDR